MDTPALIKSHGRGGIAVRHICDSGTKEEDDWAEPEAESARSQRLTDRQPATSQDVAALASDVVGRNRVLANSVVVEAK